MLPRSAISLFCDDIREEKMGMDTLVGIYPDNLIAPKFPFAFPKMCFYTRVILDSSDEIEAIQTSIQIPEEDLRSIGTIESELIETTKAESHRTGAPTMGFISKTVIAPFSISCAGVIRIVVHIDGLDYVGGILNIMEDEDSD